MITKEDAIALSSLEFIDEPQGIQILQRYIFDRKNQQIEINPPRTIVQAQLYHQMVRCAIDWYLSNIES